MDTIIHAIAEPNRRAILRIVANQEASAGEIAGHFSVSRPAVSQHLSVLKEAGLLLERREGSSRYYRTRLEGFKELREFLESFWDEKLLDLKRLIETKRGQ